MYIVFVQMYFLNEIKYSVNRLRLSVSDVNKHAPRTRFTIQVVLRPTSTGELKIILFHEHHDSAFKKINKKIKNI